jgi:hypothetical protein
MISPPNEGLPHFWKEKNKIPYGQVYGESDTVRREGVIGLSEGARSDLGRREVENARTKRSGVAPHRFSLPCCCCCASTKLPTSQVRNCVRSVLNLETRDLASHDSDFSPTTTMFFSGVRYSSTPKSRASLPRSKLPLGPLLRPAHVEDSRTRR